MDEQDCISKAEAFLEAAERTMDTGFQSHLVLPGDDVTTEVLGIVEDRVGDCYRVNIFGASSALLPLLAFDGASKRNKPNLRTGALVFCRMSLAERHVEPELSCEAIGHAVKKDWTTGLSTFGELKGGGLSRCSLMQARSLVKPSNLVLNELGKALKFEIAIGANGLLWVNSSKFVETTAILNAITASDALDEEETKTMVAAVLKNVQGLERELKKLEKSGIDPGAGLQATMLALADEIALVIGRQTNTNSSNNNSNVGSGRRRRASLITPTTPAVTRRQSSAAMMFSSLRARQQQEEVKEEKEGPLKDMDGFSSPAGFGFCFTDPATPRNMHRRFSQPSPSMVKLTGKYRRGVKKKVQDKEGGRETVAPDAVPEPVSSGVRKGSRVRRSSRVTTPVVAARVPPCSMQSTKMGFGISDKHTSTVFRRSSRRMSCISISPRPEETAVEAGSIPTEQLDEAVQFNIGKSNKTETHPARRTSSRRRSAQLQQPIKENRSPPQPAVPPHDQVSTKRQPKGTLREEKAQEFAYHAEVLAVQGMVGEAIVELERAITIAPDDWPPLATLYSGRGAGYLELGRYRAAAEDCRKALALDPTHARALALLGRSSLCTGDFTLAESSFREALVAATSMTHSGNSLEAAELRSVSDMGIEAAYAARSHLSSMIRAGKRGDTSAAEMAAEEVLALSPSCEEALETRAVSLGASHAWSEAAAFCEQRCLSPRFQAAGVTPWPPPLGSVCVAEAALLMGPVTAQVFVTALVAIGRTREAKTAISALLCHDPSICWCRELAGLIERVGQLRREARQHMENNDPVAAETLLTEAIVAFLQVAADAPDTAGLFCERSAALVAQLKWNAACQDASEALRLSPALPGGLLAMARAESGEGGNTTASIQYYETYLASNSGDAKAAMELRDVKFLQGQKGKTLQKTASSPPFTKEEGGDDFNIGKRTGPRTRKNSVRRASTTDGVEQRAVTAPGMAHCLYEVLGLPQTATISKVKKTYRKLALKYHPDKSSKTDAADHFRTLSEAYSVLSSPSKKKFYDQELMARAMSCC